MVTAFSLFIIIKCNEKFRQRDSPPAYYVQIRSLEVKTLQYPGDCLFQVTDLSVFQLNHQAVFSNIF